VKVAASLVALIGLAGCAAGITEGDCHVKRTVTMTTETICTGDGKSEQYMVFPPVIPIPAQ
jgi:hypothetical protein